MIYGALQRHLPRWLRSHVLHFEAAADRAVSTWAAALTPGARVLDAGAGEGRYARCFSKQIYCGIDLAVGDPHWNYRRLHAIADLTALPFPAASFEACLNAVTLEHVREPACVLQELARVLQPNGRILLVVPQEWEVHQPPYDYFRYTRYGMAHLLERAGFTDVEILPVGGLFRLLGRRLLNALQYFHGIWLLPAAVFLVPPGLILPLFDFLDRERKFTLGYLCTAKRVG
jgi:SAM-dependent methyltransferase